ncbi:MULTISPECIES: hypothetical protein [Halomonadaceae]|uniref:Uncharacterized protein n=1 Tax=Modicisalibacter zincidurans TaxID=1178777 RepID=A0ABP9RE62_9GAMM|nr:MULTISPECIES: hypothetical protein [Halomonas]MCD6009510.1 hypothetical protein [Halomonas sp. IOP_31]
MTAIRKWVHKHQSQPYILEIHQDRARDGDYSFRVSMPIEVSHDYSSWHMPGREYPSEDQAHKAGEQYAMRVIERMRNVSRDS